MADDTTTQAPAPPKPAEPPAPPAAVPAAAPPAAEPKTPEPPPAAAAGDEAGEPPAQPKVPDHYNLVVPEKAAKLIEPSDLEQLAALAKEQQLSQDEAQEMVEVEAKYRAGILDRLTAQTQADPEYGGAKLIEEPTARAARYRSGATRRSSPRSRVHHDAAQDRCCKSHRGRGLPGRPRQADGGRCARSRSERAGREDRRGDPLPGAVPSVRSSPMAALSTGALTLADWAKRLDPDGKVPTIVELLEQTNDILHGHALDRGQPPDRPPHHRAHRPAGRRVAPAQPGHHAEQVPHRADRRAVRDARSLERGRQGPGAAQRQRRGLPAERGRRRSSKR